MKNWNLLPGQSIVIISKSAVNSEVEKYVASSIGASGSLAKITPNEAIPQQGLDGVVSFVEKDGHDGDLLEKIVNALKPTGFVVLYEPISGRTSTDSETLSRNLTFSGFINPVISQWGEYIEVVAAKPDWEIGTTQKLTLKKKVPQEWANKGEDEELIDEDELLDEQDRASRPNTKRDDCEVVGKTKKACKNCTCGRAEAEAAPSQKKLTLDMLENPGVNSGCGSCGLGDAFRCGGCPYRGLPAFKVGEKITLPDSFLNDDI